MKYNGIGYDLVLGYGEVGKALYKIIEKEFPVVVHDPKKGKIFKGTCRVLHICINYSDKFVDIVKREIKERQPILTIIHSTVAVGTTRKIGEDVVASFVRGKHPDLDSMIKQVKHIACPNETNLDSALCYLEILGFKVIMNSSPEAVELGKLRDTTFYGICLAEIKMFKRIADHYGINWEDMEEINQTYNEGAINVGHPEWVRPTLIPEKGKIGGHCVLPNVKILKKNFKYKLLDAIEEAR